MAGIAPPIPFLTRDEILKCFDARNRTAAQEAYREFVALDSNDDERIRTAIARGGILGDHALTARVSSALDAFASEPEIPLCERFAHRASLEHLFDATTGSGRRDQRIREAYEVHRYSIGQIAAHLGLGRSTISRALHRAPLPQGGRRMTQWET
jgi:hypothetical protein